MQEETDRAGRYKRGRRGLTLIEVIIMVGIMALLASVVVRTFRPRINSAEAAALVGSLETVRLAILNFKATVGKYPSRLRLLVYPPDSQVPNEPNVIDDDACGSAFVAADIAAWRGPYLDQRVTQDGIRVGTATIENEMTRVSGETPAVNARRGELIVTVIEVPSDIAALVEGTLDSVSDFAAGMIRYTGTTLTYRFPIVGC